MTPFHDTAEVWQQRFRVPHIGWTRLAKALPTRGIVVSNRAGMYQLYAWDVPNGTLTQLTDVPTGVGTGYIAPDGSAVYYLEDRRGNEQGHIVRVPFRGGVPQALTPDLEPYSLLGIDFNHAGTQLACTIATADRFVVRCIELATHRAHGASLDLFHSPRITSSPLLSHQGNLVVVATMENDAAVHYSTLAIDTASGQIVGSLAARDYGSVEPAAFAPLPDDGRVLATAWRHGVARPLIWDVRTGMVCHLSLAELAGDIRALDWLPDGNAVLLCHFAEARQQLYLYDVATGQLRRLQHPQGTHGLFAGEFDHIAYAGADGRIYTHWQDATHPPQLLAMSPCGSTAPHHVLTFGATLPSRPWRCVTFPSSDGTTIQGWLAVPEGPGPFPTMVHVHGGPRTVMTEVCSPEAQMWLDHGLAYLTINYRGSITFGGDFEQHIWGRLGHWEVEDIVAGRAWLVAAGIADPDHIFLTGRSYGGYLTLLALGKHPALWAGGIAGVAITDWFLQYEESATPLRAYQVALFGGTPAEQADRYHESSPITYAEQVVAPLLVFQGKHDTRCSVRGMKAYEARLKALGKVIEVEWFDAGHGVWEADRQIAHAERMLAFVSACIGSSGSNDWSPPNHALLTTP